MSKLRIGFVGVGTMGQCAHLKNYAVIDDCEVVALAEIRPQLAEAVARKYGVPKVYASHEDMIAREELDGIVASQPFNRHGILVPELLKAGVPIFTEKPLANSIEAGQRILAALADSGTWQMVGYHKRSDPATAWAKAEIERLKQTGELEEMRYIRIVMPPGDWAQGGFDDLVQSDEPFPGKLEACPPPSDMDEPTCQEHDAFVNYYIHQANLMRHLLGEPYEAVFADKAGRLLVGQSASGVTCTIEMATYQTTRDWQESAFIGFGKGYIDLRLPAPVVANRAGTVQCLHDPGGETEPQVNRPHLPNVHAMRQQAINFCRALRGDAPPPCDAVEALEDLKLARQYVKLRFGQ